VQFQERDRIERGQTAVVADYPLGRRGRLVRRGVKPADQNSRICGMAADCIEQATLNFAADE